MSNNEELTSVDRAVVLAIRILMVKTLIDFIKFIEEEKESSEK